MIENGAPSSAVATRAFRIALQNPSPYERGGVVVAPWRSLAPEQFSTRVSVVDGDGMLPAQVDVLDPTDPSRTQLAFALGRPVGPGDEHYRRNSRAFEVRPDDTPRDAPATVQQFATGLKFMNDRLEFWLNTSPAKDLPGCEWFGGAVTSVQLRRFEMLHAIAAKYGFHHDPEKRCMQVDRVRLWRPAWDPEPCCEAYLYDKPWAVVATSQGPVRACATIRSSPFTYHWQDVATGQEQSAECALYRAVSLYAGADFICDEMWVRAVPSERAGAPMDLWFTPRYFMLMDLGTEPSIFRHFDIPDWFAITSPVDPHQGYGFATDVHSSGIWNPPLDFRDRDREHRAFSWELGAARTARCIHIFRRDTDPQAMAHAAGAGWYENVFKPIRVIPLPTEA